MYLKQTHYLLIKYAKWNKKYHTLQWNPKPVSELMRLKQIRQM